MAMTAINGAIVEAVVGTVSVILRNVCSEQMMREAQVDLMDPDAENWNEIQWNLIPFEQKNFNIVTYSRFESLKKLKRLVVMITQENIPGQTTKWKATKCQKHQDCLILEFSHQKQKDRWEQREHHIQAKKNKLN